MKILEKSEDFEKLIQQESALIILIGSHACAPCGAISQKIQYWRQTHAQVSFLYVPIERFAGDCSQIGIFSVPAVLVYLSGKLYLRESGIFSIAEVLGKTEYYLHMMESGYSVPCI